MTEKAKEKMIVNDKRMREDDITLEGKSLSEVQKEKLEKSAKLADEIVKDRIEKTTKPIRDEHYAKLTNFKIRIEDLESKRQQLAQEAYQYAKTLVSEYFPGEEEGKINLIEREISLEKKKED